MKRNLELQVSALLVALTATGALLVHAYLGTFSRYVADDFCTAGILRTMGFVDSQLYWYASWSGRFSFTFIVNLLEMLGPWTTSIVPALVIVALALVLGWAAHQITLLASLPSPRLSAFALSTLAVFATIDGTMSVDESVYWQTGVVTYSLPLVFLAGFAGLLAYSLRSALPTSRRRMIMSAALAGSFVAGGLNETILAVNLVASGLALVLVVLLLRGPAQGRVSRVLLALVIGTILSTVVVFSAPGNARRVESSSAEGIAANHTPVSLVRSIAANDLYFYRFSLRRVTLASAAASLFLGTVAGSLAGYAAARRRRALVWAVVIAGVVQFVMVTASIAPVTYIMEGLPFGRVLVISRFVFECFLVSTSYVVGLAIGQELPLVLRRRKSTRILLVASLAALVAVGPVLSMSRAALRADTLKDFAVEWDESNAHIEQARNSGVRSLTVSLLQHPAGMRPIGRDEKDWVNTCAASYYGLDSIVAK